MIPGHGLSSERKQRPVLRTRFRAVERQRKVAATMRRRNLNPNDAEARLAQLEQKLLEFEEQLATVLRGQANDD